MDNTKKTHGTSKQKKKKYVLYLFLAVMCILPVGPICYNMNTKKNYFKILNQCICRAKDTDDQDKKKSGSVSSIRKLFNKLTGVSNISKFQTQKPHKLSI